MIPSGGSTVHTMKYDVVIGAEMDGARLRRVKTAGK